MARVRLLVVVLAVGVCSPGTAWASTVRQWVDAVAQAAAVHGVVTSSPKNEVQIALDDAVVTLTSAGVMDEELVAFVKRYTRPDLVVLARRSQSRFAVDITGAVLTVKRIFQFLPGAAKNEPLLNGIVLELARAENAESMHWDAEVLRRLARKYGPGSAKLNGAETLLAYALQGTRGFGLDSKTGYPGPLEVVAAYTASYLTRSDDKMRLVSAAEFGVRRYFFRESWGTGSGRLAWLRPGFMSLGVAVASGSDDPLTSPFKGQSRIGPFFGWGDMKVAVLLTGSNRRVLVTQQFQIVPWVF